MEASFSYIITLAGTRIRSALKGSKARPTDVLSEYLGCSTEEYRAYLEERFEEGKRKWNIDHTTPLMYADGNPPTLEDVTARLCYTNTRPMWALENIAKGNRYIG